MFLILDSNLSEKGKYPMLTLKMKKCKYLFRCYYKYKILTWNDYNKDCNSLHNKILKFSKYF